MSKEKLIQWMPRTFVKYDGATTLAQRTHVGSKVHTINVQHFVKYDGTMTFTQMYSCINENSSNECQSLYVKAQ
jgi:hypothetical protein